jgi:hypothetical protein
MRFRGVAVPRNQFDSLVHEGLPTGGKPFVLVKRSRRVQNFSQLSRYAQIIFRRHVAVDASIATTVLPDAAVDTTYEILIE